jgi:hypothetical protein
MKVYKQTDYQDQLGTCNDTIARSGCFITSLAMLCGKTPPEVNNILRDNSGYSNGCMVNSDAAAKLLNLEYNGKSTTKPNYTCIAETNYYTPKVPQHFFVVQPDGKIIDPLGKGIKYPIVSYRLFKGVDMSEQAIKNALTYQRERNNLSTTDGGLEKDVVSVMSGDDTTLTNILTSYSKAGDLIHKDECKAQDLSKYILKTDCDARVDAQIAKDKQTCEDAVKNNYGKGCPVVQDADKMTIPELIGLTIRRILGK